MAQITATDLVVGYQAPLTPPLNFEINRGEYWVVLGHNGSGKTTTMRTLLGLLKPISGSLSFGDGLSRNQLGYLPQQTEVQRDFPASVYEVVLSGCLAKTKLRPFYNKAERALAKQNIERMGLGDYLKRAYRELSGGQQQRVLLARALCATDSLLLLDEPVSGLDPDSTKQMYEIVRGLNREGTSIVMISHDVDSALGDATHVLYLGDTCYAGTVEGYLAGDWKTPEPAQTEEAREEPEEAQVEAHEPEEEDHESV